MIENSQFILQGTPLSSGGAQGEIEVKQQNLPRSTIAFLRWLVKHPIPSQDITMDARQVVTETARLLPPAQRVRARSLLKLFENAVDAIPSIQPYPTIQMRLFVTSSPMTLDRLPQPKEPAVIATLNSVNGLSRLHVLPVFAVDDLPDFKSMEIPAGVIALFQPVPQLFNQFSDNRPVDLDAGSVYTTDRTNRDTIESQNKPLPHKIITLPPDLTYMPLTPSPHMAYSVFHDDKIHRPETLRTIEGVVVGEWVGHEIDQRNLPHHGHGVPIYAPALAYAALHHAVSRPAEPAHYAEQHLVNPASDRRFQAVLPQTAGMRLNHLGHGMPIAVGAGSVLTIANQWEPFAHPAPAEPEIAEMQEETILERSLTPEGKYEVGESSLPLRTAIETVARIEQQEARAQAFGTVVYPHAAYAAPVAYPQAKYAEAQPGGVYAYPVEDRPESGVREENNGQITQASLPSDIREPGGDETTAQTAELAAMEVSQPLSAAPTGTTANVPTATDIPVANAGDTARPVPQASITNSDQPQPDWAARREELVGVVESNQPPAQPQASSTQEMQDQIERAKKQFGDEQMPEAQSEPHLPEIVGGNDDDRREPVATDNMWRQGRLGRDEIIAADLEAPRGEPTVHDHPEFLHSHDRFDENGIRQPDVVPAEAATPGHHLAAEILLHGHEHLGPHEASPPVAAMPSAAGIGPIAGVLAIGQKRRARVARTAPAVVTRTKSRTAEGQIVKTKSRAAHQNKVAAALPHPSPDMLDKLTPGI